MTERTVLDKFNMRGKTALVTGGAGLLGKRFSLALAQAGANVVVADLNLNAAQAHAETLVSKGYFAIALALDVTDPASCKQVVAQTLERFGGIDALVNSAGMDPKFDPQNLDRQNKNAFENYDLEAWRFTLEINLTGMFLATQAAVPAMLEAGKGSIVNISSTYGLNGPDQRIYPQIDGQISYKPVDYSVAKAGVIGFTRYLAAYYAGKNIRVNALSPGGIFNGHNDDFSRNYAAKTIMGRMADIDEMDAAMLFLCSDASSYMTGSNLVVDGGWTAW